MQAALLLLVGLYPAARMHKSCGVMPGMCCVLICVCVCGPFHKPVPPTVRGVDVKSKRTQAVVCLLVETMCGCMWLCMGLGCLRKYDRVAQSLKEGCA